MEEASGTKLSFSIQYHISGNEERKEKRLSWQDLTFMHKKGLALRHVTTKAELTSEIARGVIFGDAISLAPSTCYLTSLLQDKENIPANLVFTAQLLGKDIGAIFSMKVGEDDAEWLVEQFSRDIKRWLKLVVATNAPDFSNRMNFSLLEVGARAQQAYDVKEDYPTGKVGRSEKCDKMRAALWAPENASELSEKQMVRAQWNTLVTALQTLRLR